MPTEGHRQILYDEKDNSFFEWSVLRNPLVLGQNFEIIKSSSYLKVSRYSVGRRLPDLSTLILLMYKFVKRRWNNHKLFR